MSGASVRALCCGACLLFAAGYPALPQAQSASVCTVTGTVVSGRTLLPGVVVTLSGSDGRVVDSTASGNDGLYSLRIPGPGHYTVKAEFVAFASIVREIEIDAANCQQRVDLTLTLASRAPAPSTTAETATTPAANGAAATAATAAPTPGGTAGTPAQVRAGGGRAGGAGRGQASGRGQAFQSLTLLADENGSGRADDSSAAPDAAPVLLPPGFSPETSAESVTAIGSSQPNDVFFGPNGNDLADRLATTFGGGDGGGQGPGGGFAGGRGGFGGPGGPGGFGGGPFGGRGRGNQIRGSVYQSFDTSSFDAAPYALNGHPTEKPDYFQGRYGATVGGPLVIPNIINSPRTFFFVNYTGNHSTNPYDAYSTIPTAAERAGDLSALGTVIDPTTGRPFNGAKIPSNRLDPSALALLALYPLPNQPGTLQNFHTVTTTSTDLDDINIRLVHTFGAVPQRGQGGRGRGGGGGGRGGQGGRRRHLESERCDSFQTFRQYSAPTLSRRSEARRS